MPDPSTQFSERLLSLFVGCMTGNLFIVNENKGSFPQSLWHTLLSHKKTRKATTMEPIQYVIKYIQNTNKISLIDPSAYRQRAQCPGHIAPSQSHSCHSHGLVKVGS